MIANIRGISGINCTKLVEMEFSSEHRPWHKDTRLSKSTQKAHPSLAEIEG